MHRHALCGLGSQKMSRCYALSVLEIIKMLYNCYVRVYKFEISSQRNSLGCITSVLQFGCI